jgi:hypothetical protein
LSILIYTIQISKGLVIWIDNLLPWPAKGMAGEERLAALRFCSRDAASRLAAARVGILKKN